MRNRRTIVASGCFLLFAAAAVSLFSTWLSAPVSVSPDASAVLGEVSTDSPGVKPLSGKYFSTKISTDLSIKSQNQTPQGSRLEQMLAVGQKSQSGDRLAITVGNVPPEGLESISDVQFRRNNPDTYKQVTIAGMPEGSIMFSNQKTYETSVFWSDEGMYSFIVISGLSERSQQLDHALLDIVGEWRWK